MSSTVEIDGKLVGDGQPTYIIAEIGINHNGSVDIAKRLIDSAVLAGCDAVKFQKRTPDLCTPKSQRHILRETPWGLIPYIDYRHKVEFGTDEYAEISRYCKDRAISWMASCWDEPSVDFIQSFDVPAYKVASASITDIELVKKTVSTSRPVLLSTGMSTIEEIRRAIAEVPGDKLAVFHTTSTYPCPTEELNLRVIETLRGMYKCPVGYSGHETGLQTTLAAVVLGANLIERHITLDRAMWGSDHAASLEPPGLARLVRDIRVIERAMGDGIKRVYKSEEAVKQKLRMKDST